ncbi:uncharacterized protein LOC122614618 [Drosophila teissieri]|uniref:uncharacterized protein LOC122614618 n=1 Tax=Drosophila teissieri TaxID=7243 RepID=UPI001CBA5C31|nr:uncharacterized protein LOC122614618 [Drosophila teissieri]
MDFIDDFIEEYKSNPCLWKADSADFRNRSRRQEAYAKLIEVATKHGEMYNVERTKQKINNLRCAFRHQLRKYNEVKKKGEKYEPYCPKRRYFESLMFLKDEEIPADKKCKREQSSVCLESSVQLVAPENCDEFSDAESLSKPPKSSVDPSKLSPNNSANEFCANIFEEATAAVDPVISIKTVNNTNSHASGATIKEVEIVVPANNRMLSARRKSVPDAIKSPPGDSESPQSKRIGAQNQTKLISNLSPILKTNHIIRKRSSSVSSQISEDNEPPPGKFRADISTIDFERLFSLALKSADSQLDDHFSNFGKIIAHKLRSMDGTQAIYAEKIIADVLYQGQMKMLSSLSIHQFMAMDNTTVYLESHSK